MSITIRELAKLAGVSNATVSLVLSGKSKTRVGETCRQRILDLAEKHNYRFNLPARALSERRTYRIGVCVEGALSEHGIIGQFSLYEGLGFLFEQTQNAGYAVEVRQIDSSKRIGEVCQELAGLSVDGFIFLGSWKMNLELLMLSLREKQIPACACGSSHKLDEVTWSDIDRYDAFVKVTDWALENAEGPIALLDVDMGIHWKDKQRAFIQTLQNSGVPEAETYVFRAEPPSLSGSMSLVDQVLNRFDSAAAYILTDNYYAEAVLHALQSRGIHPPLDCRVMGFGDSTLAERCPLTLSHFDLQVEQQIDFVLHALFDQIKDPAGYSPTHKRFASTRVEGET